MKKDIFRVGIKDIHRYLSPVKHADLISVASILSADDLGLPDPREAVLLLCQHGPFTEGGGSGSLSLAPRLRWMVEVKRLGLLLVLFPLGQTNHGGI